MANASTPTPSRAAIARMIDHSLLHPTLTDHAVADGLEIARRNGCATACVKPCSVEQAAEALAGSDTEVCAVVGFPHGHSHPDLTAAEAERAIAEGATEIDMVANTGKVLGSDWKAVEDQIAIINAVCRKRGALLKVIFENDYIETDHIIRLCQICTDLEVAYIKTSTGFGFVRQPGGDFNYRGATPEHVELMRRHAGPHVRIKAAGGIRSLDDVLRFRQLGVTRIGTSSTEAILAAVPD